MTQSPWIRARRQQPCPICGKPDWCMIARDGSAVLCPRTAEGAVADKGDAGYLHYLNGERKPPDDRPDIPELPKIDAPEYQDRFSRMVPAVDLDRFAADIGLSVQSLLAYGIGYSTSHRAWTWPMYDDQARVIGIRLRMADGQKLSVKGSRTGLFMLSPAYALHLPLTLLCEGPTDAAAAFDLGFEAIGRPSCRGGSKFIERILQRKRRKVIIVADRDEPGTNGALALANRIDRLADTSIYFPPEPHKDLRAWLQAGATHQEVTEHFQ